jgi:hypothetical protein
MDSTWGFSFLSIVYAPDEVGIRALASALRDKATNPPLCPAAGSQSIAPTVLIDLPADAPAILAQHAIASCALAQIPSAAFAVSDQNHPGVPSHVAFPLPYDRGYLDPSFPDLASSVIKLKIDVSTDGFEIYGLDGRPESDIVGLSALIRRRLAEDNRSCVAEFHISNTVSWQSVIAAMDVASDSGIDRFVFPPWIR